MLINSASTSTKWYYTHDTTLYTLVSVVHCMAYSVCDDIAVKCILYIVQYTFVNDICCT